MRCVFMLGYSIMRRERGIHLSMSIERERGNFQLVLSVRAPGLHVR
jgi:hypothetical protein